MASDYEDWRRRLSERFPGHETAAAKPEWAVVKQRLSCGGPVTGVVIAKAPFGAWLDIGVGFPALLEIIGIADLTSQAYRSDDWCPIGSNVTALVGRFNDRGGQIGLWQAGSPRREILSRERT